VNLSLKRPTDYNNRCGVRVSRDASLEIEASIDFLPNLVRLGQTKTVEDILRKKFENNLLSKITRIGKLQILMHTCKEAPFNSLIGEARYLFVDEYYRAAVASCGMTVESLCIAIAKERIRDKSLKIQLKDPSMSCRDKIKPLKKYLRVAKSASLLHQVLDVRKKYLHLHETQVLPEEILKCINTLHLAVIAEYGLVPANGGKVRFTTKEDVEKLAKEMGIRM